LLAVLILFLSAELPPSQTADAYVLQGPHILKLMVEQLGPARSLEVSQTVEFHGRHAPSSPKSLYEVLKYRFPDRFRSEIHGETARRIYLLSDESVLTVVDGKAEEDAETRLDLYKDILLFRFRPMLERRLRRFGVDVTVSSLGRLEEKPVYVVGAVFPDESVPQIWFDKATFLPLRWIVTRAAGRDQSDALEVRYELWEKTDGVYYPRQIDFLQGKRLVRRIHASEVTVNPVFQDRVFDIEHLRSLHEPATQIPVGQIEIEELDDVQKTIEDFGKIFK